MVSSMHPPTNCPFQIFISIPLFSLSSKLITSHMWGSPGCPTNLSPVGHGQKHHHPPVCQNHQAGSSSLVLLSLLNHILPPLFPAVSQWGSSLSLSAVPSFSIFCSLKHIHPFLDDYIFSLAPFCHPCVLVPTLLSQWSSDMLLGSFFSTLKSSFTPSSGPSLIQLHFLPLYRLYFWLWTHHGLHFSNVPCPIPSPLYTSCVWLLPHQCSPPKTKTPKQSKLNSRKSPVFMGQTLTP